MNEERDEEGKRGGGNEGRREGGEEERRRGGEEERRGGGNEGKKMSIVPFYQPLQTPGLRSTPSLCQPVYGSLTTGGRSVSPLGVPHLPSLFPGHPQFLQSTRRPGTEEGILPGLLLAFSCTVFHSRPAVSEETAPYCHLQG